MPNHESTPTTTAPTVNVLNILRVADAIERHEIADLGFNMVDTFSSYAEDLSGHNCGTTACIAGWTVSLLKNHRRLGGVMDQAATILGLDEEQASALFMTFYAGTGKDYHDILPQDAVRTLRHLAATGEVNWNLPAA